MSANLDPPQLVKSEDSSPFRVGIPIFEKMTLLDLVGLQEVLAKVPGVRTYLLATVEKPIVCDSGIRILPDFSFETAPALDMLFVPGGPGTTIVMQNRATLQFLRDRTADASWIVSVCTGALVLGAAGLLIGRRATTHWSALDLLPKFGATPIKQRVVFDGNRVTGAGVTAGIDLALHLVAEIWGTERAQTIQLGLEYDPDPPSSAGSPETAPKRIVEEYRLNAKRFAEGRRYIAEHAAAALHPGD